MTNGAAANAGRDVPEGFSFDVRLWGISKAPSKSAPHRLRWKVAGEGTGESFATLPLANGRRSELWQAMRRGEPFHIETGLPESEYRAKMRAEAEAEAVEAEPLPGDALWPDFCRAYLKARWKVLAAKTREGIADSLAAAALAMVDDSTGAPDAMAIRGVIRWVVVPGQEDRGIPEGLRQAHAWLGKHARPVSALADPAVVREVQYRITYKLDGNPAAAETVKRRRRGLNTAIEYALETKALTEHPLKGVKWPQVGQTVQALDPRVVPNPTQAREILTAVSYVGSWSRRRGRRLVAFFAVQYYAALRPAEAVGLKERDCHLPDEAWGTLTLRETRPVSGKQWTDSGERHDARGLKARAANTDRPVPIPPVLVAILKAHLKEFGTAKEGRLFGNERGDLVGTSTYWRVWVEARALALPPVQWHSIVAERPYDARHAAITEWLNAGVPVAEVARRAGNSPEVIHRRYEGCVYGAEEAANKKIDQALKDAHGE
ncbi:tyrosine-type recombinase/integrase [Embleya sp. NPDC050154]|uniref:tyrosine-type recombinase/integrase n=1 Tax=Embleya sp. NPDC050154 TaxID=3363988 RepID=UPI003798CA5C